MFQRYARWHVQTTPGCNEGVRWIVYNEALTITPSVMRSIEQYVCETNDGAGTENHYVSNRRQCQDINGRTIYSTTAAASPRGSLDHEPL